MGQPPGKVSAAVKRQKDAVEVFPERPHLTRETVTFQSWRAGTDPGPKA